MVVEVVKKIHVFYGTQCSAPCSQEPISGLYFVSHECDLDPVSSRYMSTLPCHHSTIYNCTPEKESSI